MPLIPKSKRPFNIPHYLSSVLIILLGFIAYFRILQGGFLWDDYHFVKNNIFIRNIKYLPQIFTHPIAFGGLSNFSYYRPIQEVSYMFDYMFLGQDSAFVYHFTNIILHIMVSLGLYWLVFLLIKDKNVACLCGLLFVVHPIHVESVACISGRGNSLCALFILLSYIFYVKYLEHPQKIKIVSCCIFYFLALLSKENAIIFLFLLGNYHFFYKKKVIPSALYSVIGTTIFYLIIRTVVLHASGMGVSRLSGFQERIPGFFKAIISYFQLLIVPYPLYFAKGQKIFPWDHWAVILGMMFVLWLLYISFKNRNKYPLLGWSICWFFISLLPYSNIYKVFSYEADHHIYLASMGLFVLFSEFFISILSKIKFQIFKASIPFAIIGVYLLLCIVQTEYWVNPVSFYTRTLTFNPKCSACYFNLGTIFIERKDWNSAEKFFMKSLRAGDDVDYKACNALGVVFQKQHQDKRALQYFKKSIALNPKWTVSYGNMGFTYFKLKNYVLAKEKLEKAISLNVNNDNAYYYLGLVYFVQKKYEYAFKYFKKAVEINQYNKHALFHIALFYKMQGNNHAAEDILKENFLNPKELESVRGEINSIIKSVIEDKGMMKEKK